jgi:trigger factor
MEQLPISPEVFQDQAKRRVTLGLIIGKLVEQHGLSAKPEQVRAAVEEQAQSYEHPEEVVKWFYQSQDRLREIEAVVLEENVVTWALATAKVQDEAVTFDDLMGNAK